MRATVSLSEYIQKVGVPKEGTIITVVREDTGEPLKRAFHHVEDKYCYYTIIDEPASGVFKIEKYWVELTIHVPDEPITKRETLTEHQFHVVWTEAVGRKGYDKNLFKEVLQALKDKNMIV